MVDSSTTNPPNTNTHSPSAVSAAVGALTAQLVASPIFSLCLSDKELFHSNFLGWLFTLKTTDGCDFGLEVLNRLMDRGAFDRIPAGCKVCREYDYLDLAIVEGKPHAADSRCHLVIENKVKSLPSDDQLKRYNGKMGLTDADGEDTADRIAGDFSRVRRLLLTFIAPGVTEMEGWRIMTYRQMCDIITSTPGIDDLEPYHRAIINDYCQFNSAVLSICSHLSGCNRYDVSKAANRATYGTLKTLRLGGLIEQYHVATIAARLSNAIAERQIAQYKIRIGHGHNGKRVELWYPDHLSRPTDPNEKALVITVDRNNYSRGVYPANLNIDDAPATSADNERFDRLRECGYFEPNKQGFIDRMGAKYPQLFVKKRLKPNSSVSPVYNKYHSGNDYEQRYQYANFKPGVSIDQVVDLLLAEAEQLPGYYAAAFGRPTSEPIPSQRKVNQSIS